MDGRVHTEMRLIDANALKRYYAWWGDSDETKRLFDTIIYRQPTVDPVRHGEWIPSGAGCLTSKCSVCGNKSLTADN